VANNHELDDVIWVGNAARRPVSSGRPASSQYPSGNSQLRRLF